MTYWSSHVKRTTKHALHSSRKVMISYIVYLTLLRILSSRITIWTASLCKDEPAGVDVFDAELLLNGIVTQKLDYERFVTKP